MMTLEVRQLSADEWEVERDLRLSALRDAPSAFNSRAADAERFGEREWRDRLQRQVRFAVWLEGQPVGTIGCVADADSDTVDVVGTWVDPVARGRGAGDLLLQAVFGWTRDRQRHILRLWVSTGNDPAERLYARHGFVRAEQAVPDGAHQFEMRCKLD